MTSTLTRSIHLDDRPGKRRATTPAVRKFRPDIEGLRAFAVVSVVLYHADIWPFTGGFVGVDVFFVISGFLITRQLLSLADKGGFRTLPTFYTRRIRRLLPASVTVVIATLAAAYVWAPKLMVPSIAWDGIFTTFYGLNYRLAIEGTQYQEQTGTPSPLQHFWSLGVEEQFYVIWPVMIILVTTLGRRFRVPLLIGLLGAITAISFYYSVTITESNAPWAYFSLHTRAWELSAGALVAVAAGLLARLPKVVCDVGAFVGLTGLVASAFVYGDATPFPGSAAALPVGGAMLVIGCGCGSRTRIERWLADPLCQCVGRVSYSWYLWHWPMLIITPMAVGHALNWPSRMGVVLLSLIAAIVSFFFIEDPARRLNFSNTKWLAGGGLLSGSVILVAALVLTHLPSAVGHGQAVAAVQVSSSSPDALTQVQKALAAGLQVKDAPSNLTPEPAHAGNDLPDSSRNGCHAGYTVVQQGPCVYGDPAGAHTVVLFGDSHMEQWMPAFSAVGASTHWRVVNWTKSACPPAELTVNNPSLNRTYTECNDWRKVTLDRIAALNPDLVIMSESENIASRAVTPKQFAAATLQTLQTLKQTTHATVSFMSDIPVPNYDMPGCVAEHLGSVTSCVFDTRHAYTYPDRHALLGPAIRAKGFTVIDPAPWLCTGGKCPAVVGNLLVYRNESHMTAKYSAWLAPMVAPLLTTSPAPSK